LKVYVAELVAAFKLAVVIAFLLDGIVGEVDEPAGDVFEVEFLAAGPEVAFIVPVALQVPVHTGQQRVAPNIELAPLIQQRLLNVLLDDVGALGAVDHGVVDDVFDGSELLADVDAAAPVGVLAGLHDPHRPPHLLQDPPVQPQVVPLEQLLELREFLIIDALFDVEGEWEDVEIFEALALVEDLHVVEEGLLVAEVEVVLHVVTDHYLVRHDTARLQLLSLPSHLIPTIRNRSRIVLLDGLLLLGEHVGAEGRGPLPLGGCGHEGL